MIAAADPSECTEEHRFYHARGTAVRLMHCKAPEVLLSGPAGTGKSRACLEKIHFCAGKYAGMRALIVRKTRESLSESALFTFEVKVVPPGHPILAPIQRNNRQHYHYDNGSEVVVGGLDKPQKIMSTEYDMVYVQEAIELSENDWESLTTRLRNGMMPYQQILADTNPDAPTHWLRRRCDADRCVMLESRHEDNPTLYDHARSAWTDRGGMYIAKLDALTGVRRARLRFGRWAAAEGVVYEGFDRDIHLVDRGTLSGQHFPRYVAGVDWGFTNPGTLLVFGVDGDGRMVRVHEVYRPRRLIGWWVDEATKAAKSYRIEAFACDPSEPAYIRAFREAGLPARPAYNEIKPGIQAIEDRLRVAPDGRPRLTFVRDEPATRDEELAEAGKPTSTVDEFDSYAWPRGADGRPTKELPVDDANHGLDALRYAVAHVDGLTARGGRAVAVPNPLAGWRG